MEKMKIIAFLALFVLGLASLSLARGLEITEVDVHVDYDEAYTYRIENRERKNSATVPIVNNSKIDADIFPGSNVTFTVRVENTFQRDKETIKDTVVTIKIEEIDDQSDMEENSLDFELEPGGDERFDVKFAIPLEADAGTYKMFIEAEGEDKNRTFYRTELMLKLEVRK